MWGRSIKLTIPPDTLTALFVTRLSPPKNTDKQSPLSQGRHLGPLSSGCNKWQSCLQYPVAAYPLICLLSGAMTSLGAAKLFTCQRRKGCFLQTGAKPGAATSSISWVKEFPSQPGGRYQPCQYRSQPQRQTGTLHPGQKCHWSTPGSSSCA